MKNALPFLVCVSLYPFTSLPAHAVEALELRASRVGDVNLSCGRLSEEAVLMREIISTTEDIKDDSELKGHGINAATGIGSFLIGSATGGIGLAAAGFLLTQTNNESAVDADSVQDIAEQRRALMVGIYNAKGCFGPMDHALQDGRHLPTNAVITIAAVEPAAGEKDDGDSPAHAEVNDHSPAPDNYNQ